MTESVNQSSRILLHVASEAERKKMYAEADKILSDAMRMGEKSGSSRNSEYASLLIQMADLCGDNERFEKAEHLYSHAISILKSTLGPDHISTLLAVRNFGELLSKMGKQEDADSLCQGAKENILRHFS